MTKKQYISLKEKMAKDPNLISFSEAHEMEIFIKKTVLMNLQTILIEAHYPRIITDFIILMVHSDFGCLEVDSFLINIKAYPEWLHF